MIAEKLEKSELRTKPTTKRKLLELPKTIQERSGSNKESKLEEMKVSEILKGKNKDEEEEVKNQREVNKRNNSSNLFINESMSKYISVFTNIVSDIIKDYEKVSTAEEWASSQNMKNSQVNSVSKSTKCVSTSPEKKSNSLLSLSKIEDKQTKFKNSANNLKKETPYSYLDGALFPNSSLKKVFTQIILLMKATKSNLIHSMILLDKLFNTKKVYPTVNNIQK